MKRDNQGRFVKGIIPWNKGLKIVVRTKDCEVCNKIFYKNRKYSHAQWARARTCSRKCSGIIHHREFRHTLESNNKNRQAHLGRVTMSGESHYNWKGGITPLRTKLYFSKEYKIWRTAVFVRDDFTCQICGKKGGELNADHIKPWASYPELRYAIDNGRTLCIDCHRATDTWGVRPHDKAIDTQNL